MTGSRMDTAGTGIQSHMLSQNYQGISLQQRIGANNAFQFSTLEFLNHFRCSIYLHFL